MLKSTRDHEWILIHIGIAQQAQELLGDVVFVELPKLGRSVEAGESVAIVESVNTPWSAPLPGCQARSGITHAKDALRQIPSKSRTSPDDDPSNDSRLRQRTTENRTRVCTRIIY
jgi:glycine cleavage system H protein